MDTTVCELFAGAGGFRCGLNNIKALDDTGKEERFKTVWFNQYEPSAKKQYAHGLYTYHFGTCMDKNRQDTTNLDIAKVDKKAIPDFNLLTAGFPCQDYSVAKPSPSSKGIEGKKGALWWQIMEVIREKKPPFCLFENVDRLLKSPSGQRGRDFGIILSCLNSEGYIAEWRVINAADYGCPQRRKRVFIFAFHKSTGYARNIPGNMAGHIGSSGLFASAFPVYPVSKITDIMLPQDVKEVSGTFCFQYRNAGIMKENHIYSTETEPVPCNTATLGDIMEAGDVGSQYFIPDEKLYYTLPCITHSDETKGKLPDSHRHTWQYIKGAKKLLREKNGHQYIYSEGAMPMVDAWDKPARTMLTSEGSFARTTHIVEDKKTGRIRKLTETECERIQMFPDSFTKYYLENGKVMEMPPGKRRFLMGNALVTGIVSSMADKLYGIMQEE